MQYRGNREKRFGMTGLPLLRKMENATSRADPITAGASISSSTNVSTNKSSRHSSHGSTGLCEEAVVRVAVLTH